MGTDGENIKFNVWFSWIFLKKSLIFVAQEKCQNEAINTKTCYCQKQRTLQISK